MTKHDFTYELWEPVEDGPVSTSPLYRLEPVGVGTPLVESLTSYLKRLAYAHHVTVEDLMRYCKAMAALPPGTSTPQKLIHIDGITPSADLWSRLLQRLTLHEHVPYLTMGYWQFLLNPYRLIRQTHTWCPQCYAEWIEQDQVIYEPLLWRLDPVKVCLVHHCQLMDVCQHCGKQARTVTSKVIPGFCPYCHTWLGNNTSRKQATDPSPSDWLVEGIGQLLALAPLPSLPETSVVIQAIRMLQQRDGLPNTKVASSLGIGISAMQTLLLGRRKPNLKTFIRLCHITANLPFKLLIHGCLPESFIAEAELEPVPTMLQGKLEKQFHLEALLASPHPLPEFSTVVRRCGHHYAWELREEFPHLYSLLLERFRCEIRQALLDILQSDAIMGVTDMARKRGYLQGTLFYFYPDLCKQVARVAVERKKAKCRHALGEILRSDPPVYPSVWELTQTLQVSKYYLMTHFPDEVAQIRRVNQLQAEQEKEAIRSHLNAAVHATTSPPQSLEQIIRHFGKTRKYFKRWFPEQSQQIIANYKIYQKQVIELQCQQIKAVIFELHQQDIYPGIDRIHAAIDVWLIRGTPYRRAYTEAMLACGYSV